MEIMGIFSLKKQNNPRKTEKKKSIATHTEANLQNTIKTKNQRS